MITRFVEEALDFSARNLGFGNNRLHHQLNKNGFSSSVCQVDQNVEGVILFFARKIVQLVCNQALAIVIIEINDSDFTDLRHCFLPP